MAGKRKPKTKRAAAPSSNNIFLSSEISIGDVGYTFRKQFDDGWYIGKVARIRLGAAGGKDRRCHYEDGDSEDLSLAELRSLALLDPSRKSERGVATNTAPRGGSGKEEGDPEEMTKAKTIGVLDVLTGTRMNAREDSELGTKGMAKEYSRKVINEKGKDFRVDTERRRTKITAKKSMKSHTPNTPKPEVDRTLLQSGNGNATKSDGVLEAVSTQASENRNEQIDGARRSGRTVRAPRKVDEIYDYIHIRTMAKKAKADLPTPQKKAKILTSCLDDIIPLDRAAESTFIRINETEKFGDARMEKSKKNYDAEENGKWLEKVAASLGAADQQKRFSKSFHRSSTNSSLDGPALRLSKTSAHSASISHSNVLKSDAASICSTITCVSDNKFSGRKYDSDTGRQPPEAVLVSHPPAESADMMTKASLPLLSEYSRGNRHGHLVFHKNDSQRRVAEVILEHDSSWVEVAVDGSLKKYRASHLYVVPPNQLKPGEQYKAPLRTGLNKKLRTKVLLNDMKPPALTVDNLFCWFCQICDADNKIFDMACHSCNAPKSSSSKRSILLELAEKAVTGNVKTVEGAMSRINVSDRPSIPERLIAYLLEAKVSATPTAEFSLKPSHNIDTQYFYWMCGSCTMQNSYRRTTCSACLQGKGLADRSPLLKLAEDAAMDSKTSEEALSSLTSQERLCVPKVVMDALVTCIFVIEGKNGQNRRCRKQKKEGYDYCEAHFDPILLRKTRADPKGSTSGSVSCDVDDSLSQTSLQASHRFMGCKGVAVNEIMPAFLNNIHPDQVNELNWTINNIENAVLCGGDAAFPLGMKVRKFFQGYGFHDGRIIKVARKLWSDDDSASKEQRPILVYRLKYNDGDQEDFLHHEISSLRKIYDISKVSPEEPPEVQIPINQVFETRFGTVTIIGHITPPGIVNRKEGGKVVVMFQDSTKHVELDLLEFQKAVLHKNSEVATTRAQSPLADKSRKRAPVLEWPRHSPNQGDDESNTTSDEHHAIDICEGLSLHRKRCNASPDHEAVAKFPSTSAMNNPVDVRPGCNVRMWDPASCYNYLSWDPYASTICEICGIDDNDNQVVICDECHSGFHSYCLRPVMVNIPKGDWLCSACSAGRSDVQVAFREYSDKMQTQYVDIFRYLGLPYKSGCQFFRIHSEAMNLFSLGSQNAVKQQAMSQQIQAKYVVFNVGDIKFIRSPEKHDWILPSPLKGEKYMSSILSMVAAMKYCGMEKYIVDHIYSENVSQDMNDPSLEVDGIAPLNRRNLEIFQAYKHNLTLGIFPPVQIFHDENFGFSVKALASMSRHTIIGEYLGEVTTMEQSSYSNSDSLMVLLDTGDPKTSLIIDPTRAGNIARFLSGVNNRSLLSKRKANVRTRRFFMDGKVHVCLFTSRRVESGEILNYDYNAGNEGKNAVQWARSGFYDTSNFF